MKKIIVAIDGHSSCGKSTIGKALAAKLGYTFIDSGAMYRAVALYFDRNNIEIHDAVAVDNGLKQITIDFEFNSEKQQFDTFLNGENVSDVIRNLKVADDASKVSTISAVRRFLVAQQQEKGTRGGVIMDGRDIGTVVFPDAELKIFVTASPEIRARRRMEELQKKNITCTFEEVMKSLLDRDHNDSTRADSPLRKADDALELDTSELTPQEQLDKVYRMAMNVINAANES